MRQPDLTPAQIASRARMNARLKAEQDAIEDEPEGGYGPEPEPDEPEPPVVEQKTVTAWEDPAPLGRSGTTVPFPLQSLPPWLGDYVIALAHATQTPPDLAAMLCIAVMAGAAGGRAVVEVRAGWREPLNLFIAVAMPPGARKTPVFQRVTLPLVEAEQTMLGETRSEILDTQVRKQAARDLADRAAMDAARASEDAREEAINYAKVTREMAEAIDVPAVPRLFADDATPEALASLLAEQRGRIAIYSDEGEVFSMMAGRYSGTANLGVYLKGHAGSPLRVDRKGRPPEYIKAPALTMGLAIQPGVLASLRAIDGGRDRGLLARFLWVLPPDNVGDRMIAADPVPEPVAGQYEAHVAKLAKDLSEWTDPAVLVFAPGADMGLRAMEEALEPRMHRSHGDLAHIADWVAKLAGHTARIAGLLHLAENPTDWDRRTVAAETVIRARLIGEYLLLHANEAFNAMEANPVINEARYVVGRLHGVETISRRDLYCACQGKFPQVSDMMPAVGLLVAHGYLRPVPETPVTRRGRKPSPRYEVHPWVTEGR